MKRTHPHLSLDVSESLMTRDLSQNDLAEDEQQSDNDDLMIKGNIFFGFIAPFYIHFTPFCKHQQQATINRGISIKTRSAEQKSTFFLSSWYVAIIFFFI